MNKFKLDDEPEIQQPTSSDADAMACYDFWGCVARSVEAIAAALPRVPHGNGYALIELATQLKRLVDIIERASMPLLKIDSQNVDVDASPPR